MSRAVIGRNILRQVVPQGTFLDQLQSIHAVAAQDPTAKLTKSQIDQKFAEAHDQGVRLGYAAGFAQGEAKGIEAGLEIGEMRIREEHEAAHAEAIAAFAQDLSRLLSETQKNIDQWYQETEERLAVLAVEIARRAVSQELSINPDVVVAISKQVLQEVTTGNHVRLRVNPVQSATLEARREEIIRSVSHIRDIEVVSDPKIENGIVVESDSGVVDARVETYLHRLADHISEEAA